MILGFTGTQEGMSDRQKDTVQFLITSLWPQAFHHGDCIGADEGADWLFRIFGNGKIYIHPPDIDTKRAFCHRKDNILHKSIVLPEKPYLDRNKDIVTSCDLLLVCPKTPNEERRSGTWSTWRYANAIEVPAIIIV